VLTGKPGFALFDIAPIGLIVALAGTLFVVFAAPKLLKVRRSPDQTFADTPHFTFEVAVARDGPLVGKTIQQAGLRHLERIYLAEIERDGSVITAVAPEEMLRGGDRLVFVGETEAIVDVLRINGLVAAVGSQPRLERNVPERRLVEAVVAEHCDVVGHTIRDGRFRDRYGAVVLAVARNGEHIRGRLSSIILEPGDLVAARGAPGGGRPAEAVPRLPADERARARTAGSFARLHLMGDSRRIIVLATTGLMSMLNAALLGVAAMLATRCIGVNEARRALDLPVLVTIAASFALGNALEKTGARNTWAMASWAPPATTPGCCSRSAISA